MTFAAPFDIVFTMWLTLGIATALWTFGVSWLFFTKRKTDLRDLLIHGMLGWLVTLVFTGTLATMGILPLIQTSEQEQLIEQADQVYAIPLDQQEAKTLLQSEEGKPGWMWTTTDGRNVVELGSIRRVSEGEEETIRLVRWDGAWILAEGLTGSGEIIELPRQ